MFANQLQLARALELPTRQAMLYREPAVQHFWNSNTDLITNAWSEWGNNINRWLNVYA